MKEGLHMGCGCGKDCRCPEDVVRWSDIINRLWQFMVWGLGIVNWFSVVIGFRLVGFDMDMLPFGIATARRAWVEPTSVINTWDTGQLLDWLKSRPG